MTNGSLSLLIKNGPMTVCDANGLTTESARDMACRHLGIATPAVALNADEAKALRAYVMGDAFETDSIDSFLNKADALPYEDDDA